MNIIADVVDIRVDTPQPDESFLVDTNVWYWMTYSRASSGDNPPLEYQTNLYPDYISKAITNSSKLFWCGLSLSELAHIIEKTEREIFNRTNGRPIGTKAYRHNASERAKVMAQIKASWDQVKNIGESLPAVSLDESLTEKAFIRLQAQAVDGYDLFILEALCSSTVINVITDDSDYASVPGVKMFTANRNIIHQAQICGKLHVRR